MRGIINLFFLIIICFVEIQAQHIDSLSQALAGVKGENRIEILNELTIKTWLNYPEQAMSYALEALVLSHKAENEYLLSTSLRLVGSVHFYLGNYDSAIVYCEKALRIAFEVNNPQLISTALNNLGLIHFSLGSYQNALENLLRSINIKTAEKIDYGKGLTLNNIGLVYLKLKDFKIARKYFYDALKEGRNHQDSNLILYTQNNIAQTYLDEMQLDQAEGYFEKSLSLAIDNNNWKATAYSGMGKVAHAKKNYLLSNQYFRKALELRTLIGDKTGISEVYYFFSKAESERGNLASALSFLNKSQKIATEINRRDRMLENYALYAEIHKLRNNMDSAFLFQTKYLELKDSLFNENLARNLSSIHLKIQEEESQRIISFKDQQLAANKELTTSLVIVVILSILLTFLIHYGYKNNKRVNGILAERNDKITDQKKKIEKQKDELLTNNIRLESAQELIKDQNKKLAMLNMNLKTKVDKRTQELEYANKNLKMANLELDNFIYKSSHDIRGPLATLMGICNVAIIDVKDKMAIGYFKMLQKISYNLNDILERLKTISDINNFELSFWEVNFEKIISRCHEQNINMEGAKQFIIQKEIDQDLRYWSDPVLLDIIFYNLIQNAIRFHDPAQYEKLIFIRVHRENDNLYIDFKDNGIGIKQSEVGNIFEMFSKAATKHQTIGLGLYIVKQSVQKLGGEIILTEDTEMTHFKIKLPVYSEKNILFETVNPSF